VDLAAFTRAATAGQLPPVVVIHGDAQLADDALATATAALFADASLVSLGREVLDADTATVADVVRSAMTLPLMTAVRLVAVRRAHAFKPAPELAAYVEDPNPTSCLLLLSDEFLDANPRERRQRHWLLDAVPAAAVVTLGARQGGALGDWLRQRASQEGLTISADAAKLLVEWVGDDTATLLGEARKAALAGTGAPGTVGVKDVEAVVGEHRLAQVWDLTGAIEKRNAGAALRALDRLLAVEDAMRLLALLSTEVRTGWRIAELAARGQSAEQIARSVNRPFGVVRARLEGAGVTSEATFAARLSRCRDVEHRLKSGGEPRAELAALVAELASGRG
jgi:DNA polymerase III delta subunit